MAKTATERYGIALAPGGLALVQELLNTVGVGAARQPDLLEKLQPAQEWLHRAVALWAERTYAGRPPDVSLSERDLPKLRELRDRLRRSPDRQGPRGTERAGSLRVTLGPDGQVAVRPAGQGARWVTSAVLGELYLAHQNDTWRRLKVCRNEPCGTAFYDRSRNNSGVWHDVRICGNAVNLRASRARRKQLT